MDGKRLLVIAGDFDVVQRVKQTLDDKGFAVQSAYSHRDAMYSLRQGSFDAAIVASAMSDRSTGARTCTTLSQIETCPPLIIYAPDGYVGMGGGDGDVVIDTLDEQTLRSGVLRALRIPVQATAPLPDDLRGSEANGQFGSWSREEVQTFLALSRSLTEVLDLSEVLNRVVEAARHLTDAEEGMILLPDDEAGELYLRAKVGIDLDVARNFRIKTKDTLAGQVFNSGHPALVGARGPQKVKTEYFVNSLLYVPILLQGHSIGVLGVNNKTKHDVFTTRHQELLMNLASYAAIAIENARIHGQTIKRGRELKALVDASEVINSSLSLDKTLPNICEQLVRVLGVHHSEILEWQRETNQLRMLSRYHHTVWRAGYEPVIPLAQRYALQLVLDKGSVQLVDRERRDRFAEEWNHLTQLGASSQLMIPIQGGEQTFGVIFAYYVNPLARIPDAEVIQSAQQLALEVLINLSKKDGQTASQTFRLAAEVNDRLGASWSEYAVLNGAQQTLKVHVSVGNGVWLVPPFPGYDLNQYADLAEAIETQSVINDFGASKSGTPGSRALLEATRSRSILALPLIYRGQAQGLVLFADAEHNHLFNNREMDVARAIVGQAATALENARLVHDLEASLIELKEAQERLIQTARLTAMGELAAAVAHQINNPLTTIVLDTELLLLDTAESDPDHQVLGAISRAGKRAAGVVRRLLATVRPNAPSAPLEPINIVYTIQETLALVRSHIEREGIRLTATFPDDELPPVSAIPGELDDVWLNLLLNAHDALTGRKGAAMGIDVEYQPRSDHLNVVVWDNGPGIPAEIHDEIFKPFFTTKPVGEGTGLGLHICRQIVDRVGGTIEVESVPNELTQFVIRLPVIRSGRL